MKEAELTYLDFVFDLPSTLWPKALEKSSSSSSSLLDDIIVQQDLQVLKSCWRHSSPRSPVFRIERPLRRFNLPIDICPKYFAQFLFAHLDICSNEICSKWRGHLPMKTLAQFHVSIMIYQETLEFFNPNQCWYVIFIYLDRRVAFCFVVMQ